MKIEQLSVENLRDGVFCAKGKPHGEDMYGQIEAWLDGSVLRGQVARADDGRPAGFILYYPIEQAPLDVTGSGLYMVQCVFVKPEFQDQGIGRALVESAIADARECGAEGIAAQGYNWRHPDGFDYLPGTFYQHLGMTAGESRGTATLYFAPFQSSPSPPRYLEQRFEPPADPSRVRIDLLDCRRCYTPVRNREVVKTVAEGLGREQVNLVIHDQNDRSAILDKGMSSGVFIDGKLTFFQGPIAEDDVWRAIQVAASARERHTDR